MLFRAQSANSSPQIVAQHPPLGNAACDVLSQVPQLSGLAFNTEQLLASKFALGPQKRYSL